MSRRIVTLFDKEEINKLIYQMKQNKQYWSWRMIAEMTGWSKTTCQNYYDKNYYPNKYSSIEEKKTQYPQLSGLYMLTNIILNDGKPEYLIKVGQSKTNLNNRINSYKGMNPTAKCISTFICPTDDLNNLEKSYHTFFKQIGGIRKEQTEWYSFDKKTFDEICNIGLI